jgi:phosphoribosylamine--glycine ligase
VLVVGSGAREHAIVRALAADSAVESIVAAPGNPGIAALADVRRLDLSDPAAIADLAVDSGADLVVVGPEAPLVAGAADAVRERGIACFGPSAAAARIEGSKAYAKEVMAAAGVPTAMAHVCETPEEVVAALDAFGPPYVVKDDALAAGKGVVVTDDRDEAIAHAAACGRVVIEEYLDGPEISLLAISDGETVLPLELSQDFKRLGDSDAGPNTGGMGAYSPLSWAPRGLRDDAMARVVQPTIDELRNRGTPFVGVLYAGLALTSRGIRVVEFNCRFGDPETQVVLARLRTPLGALLHAAATGRLAAHEPPAWHGDAAVTVVIAAEGYPGSPRRGDPITGVEQADDVDGTYVLHAGTAIEAGQLVSAGGRVMSVVGIGDDLTEARERAYEAVDRIALAGSTHRTDVAERAAAGTVQVPSTVVPAN